MNALAVGMALVAIVVVVHEMWVLAYALSPRRALENRIRAYTQTGRLFEDSIYIESPKPDTPFRGRWRSARGL